MKKSITKGVFVPMITPFNRDQSVNVEELKRLTQIFIDKGVDGLVVCGTTGEYYSFDEHDRTLVMTTVASIAKDKVVLVAGINDLSTAASISKAEQAKQLGYDGLMLAVPSYSLPEQNGVIAHYQAVAAATELPIVMYHCPARTGVEMSIETVLTLATIDNIVGIKESSGDFSRALHLIQADIDGCDVVCGCDDQAADFLFWGAKGWISGAANVFPAEQVEMMRLARNNEWTKVKSLMLAMYPAIYSMESSDYNQKAKLGCKRHGIEAGAVRLPLMDMSTEDKDEFLALLEHCEC